MNQQQINNDGVYLPPLLRLALSKGNADSVLLHFDRGIAINCFDRHGRTPLMIAAAGGHTKLCLLLLEKGADPSLADTNGSTASELSRENGHVALADALSREPALTGSYEFARVTETELHSPMVEGDVMDEAGDLLGWEPEAETSTVAVNIDVLPVNQLLQTNISLFRPQTVMDAWSHVEITLPSWGSESRIPPGVRRVLPLCVANLQVTLSRLTLAWPKASAEHLRLLVLSLEVAGIRVTRSCIGARYTRAMFTALPTANDVRVASDIEEYLAVLIAGVAPVVPYEQEIEQAGVIDRAMEQRIFSSFAESHHLMLLAFQNSEHVIGWMERQLSHGDAHVYNRTDSEDQRDEDEEEDEGADHASYRSHIENILGLLKAPAKVTRELASHAHTSSRLIAAIERTLRRAPKDDEIAVVALRTIRKYYSIRDRIVRYGLRFLEYGARAYRGALTEEDLIQEGTFGLIRAIERFNPAFGHRFQTYASPWIRQSMSRAVDDYSRMVRIPVHVCETARKVEKFVRAVTSETGKQPTSADIAGATEIPRNKVVLLQSVPSIRASSKMLHMLSVPEPLPHFQAERSVEAKMIQRTISDTLLRFDAREERILRMRFGIGLSDDFTLEEVGNYFGVTRERIRQIEAKALRRLYQYRIRFNLPRRLGDMI